jgi:hypothetical protein
MGGGWGLRIDGTGSIRTRRRPDLGGTFSSGFKRSISTRLRVGGGGIGSSPLMALLLSEPGTAGRGERLGGRPGFQGLDGGLVYPTGNVTEAAKGVRDSLKKDY